MIPVAERLATESTQGAAFYAQDLIRIIRVCSGGRHGHRAKYRHGYAKPRYGNTDRHLHYAIAAGDNNAAWFYNDPAWLRDNAAKFRGNSAHVAAQHFHRKSGRYARDAGCCRQCWIGTRQDRQHAEPDGHHDDRSAAYSVT